MTPFRPDSPQRSLDFRLSEKIRSCLPGYNCGRCGKNSCAAFAGSVCLETVSDCPFLKSERFRDNDRAVRRLLEKSAAESKSGFGGAPEAAAKDGQENRSKSGPEDGPENGYPFRGLVDHAGADLILGPLEGDSSCRETLYPFDREYVPKTGDRIRYRPLGCPIVHFAEITDVRFGLLTVRMIGPVHRLDGSDMPKDIGLCLVAAFEGRLKDGAVPDVCQTVRFIPDACMMGKVHSGIVVSCERDKLRIEAIDLKVW